MGKTNIPVSAHFNKPLGQVWGEILDFHACPGARILDPTCGEKLLWKDVDASPFEVTYHDLAVDGQDFYTLPEVGGYNRYFDLIIFDPPYFFGTLKSSDPREPAYGGYSNTKTQLQDYMLATHQVFPYLLKPHGKIIVKCADMYYVPEKTFYPLHFWWMKELEKAFHLVDLFVYKHAHTSPTAWQVKNRRSSVIAHTYFLVGELFDWDWDWNWNSKKEVECA